MIKKPRNIEVQQKPTQCTVALRKREALLPELLTVIGYQINELYALAAVTKRSANMTAMNGFPCFVDPLIPINKPFYR
jgi:hypothetical protein